MATVYGEKSDSGMSSMSLREVYLEPHTDKRISSSCSSKRY